MATVKLLSKLVFTERQQGEFDAIGNLGELLKEVSDGGGTVTSNSKGTGLVLRDSAGKICNVVFSQGIQDDLKAGTLNHGHLVNCPVGAVVREDNGETMYILGRVQGSATPVAINVTKWLAKAKSVPARTVDFGLDKLIADIEG